MDKDGTPELLIEYWEQGRYYIDLYTCQEEKPILAGTFYSGRTDSQLYIHPEEAGLWNKAVRADPAGETHWWRKFTLPDGILTEEELLEEQIPWGEGPEPPLAFAPTEAAELIPGAIPLEPAPINEENIEKAFLPTLGEEKP